MKNSKVITKAEIARAADVARTENVTIEIECVDRIIRVSPAAPLSWTMKSASSSSRGVVL